MDSFETCRASLDQWEALSIKNPKLAARKAREDLDRVHVLGDPPELLALALSNMGACYRQAGDFKTAIGYLQRSATLYCGRFGLEIDEAGTYRRLGYAYAETTAFPDALDTADRAAKIYKSPEWVARCRLLFAYIRYRMRQYVDAIQHILEALPDLPPGIYRDEAFHNLLAAFLRMMQAGQTLPTQIRKPAHKAVRLARMSLSSRLGGKTQPPTQRRSYGSNRPTPADAKARWVIGLLLEMDREYQSAAHYIESGCKELARHGVTRLDVAEAGLDLCRIYARLGRWRTVVRVAQESVEVIGEHLPEARESFEEWLRAARSQDFEQMCALTNDCRDAFALCHSSGL